MLFVIKRVSSAADEEPMKMRILLVAIPLLIVGGIAILVWRMAARQQAEARYHASLTRALQISSDAFEDNGDIIVHWVLYNIPGDVAGLDSGVTDTELSDLGIKVGPNWSGETRYYPPCPVSGRHRYVFRLYALDVDAIQPETDNRQGVLRAMENHVIAYGELNGFYAK
jgi:Raf kinase inhibitor-like YbhB/YbcL family protein